MQDILEPDVILLHFIDKHSDGRKLCKMSTEIRMMSMNKA